MARRTKIQLRWRSSDFFSQYLASCIDLSKGGITKELSRSGAGNCSDAKTLKALYFILYCYLFYRNHSEPAVRDTIRVEQAARRVHPSALKRAQRSRPNGHGQSSMSDAEDRAGTPTRCFPFIGFGDQLLV